jgi:hypothetical protein
MVSTVSTPIAGAVALLRCSISHHHDDAPDAPHPPFNGLNGPCVIARVSRVFSRGAVRAQLRPSVRPIWWASKMMARMRWSQKIVAKTSESRRKKVLACLVLTRT